MALTPVQTQIIDFPVSAASNDPEKTMAQGEIRTVLEKAIDELPDSYRAVFVARIVEAMTVEETADLYGPKTPDGEDEAALRSHAVTRYLGQAAWSHAHQYVSVWRPSLRCHDREDGPAYLPVRWEPPPASRNLSPQQSSKQASGFSTHRPAGCRLNLR